MNSRSTAQRDLTIAQAAQATGLSIDTLRYYERQELLPAVRRDPAGRRRYDSTDLGWISLICCLRDTGMPLAQIKTFTTLTSAGDSSLPARVDLLHEHDRQLQETITNLRKQQRYLRGKVGDYERRLRAAKR